MTYKPGLSAAPAYPASCAGSPRSSAARNPSAKAAARRGVRNSVKPVGRPRDYDAFLGRLSSKNTAAKLLRSAGQDKLAVRVSQCVYVRRQSVVTLSQQGNWPRVCLWCRVLFVRLVLSVLLPSDQRAAQG